MDLTETIRQLLLERERLDRVIARLEQLENPNAGDGTSLVKGRRGRKSMSQEERREVSERMRHYWASRRQRKLA